MPTYRQAMATMTMRARDVLQDCESALDSLVDCPYGPVWRQRWVAAVALLRAVGHVLDKIDAASDSSLQKASSSQYAKLKASKPEPAIFWQFIVEERNLILKEYNFRGAHASTSAHSTSIGVAVPGGPLVTRTVDVPQPLDIHIFTSGPFAGRHQAEVAQEAARWWRSYLDTIDALVKEGM